MTNDGTNSYTYDAEGNVTQANATSYVYDVFNHRIHTQSSSATTEFTYDYAGRRISSWLSPSNYGNEGRIYWDGEQTNFRSADGTTYFDHQDTLGTERMRTNYSGGVGSTIVSLPWGDGYTSPGNTGVNQDNSNFAGLEYDAESGTEHAQHRNYAPAQGRWLSPDPALGSYDLTNPSTFNRYAYGLNNPTSFTDKSGQEVCQECIGVGGGDDDDDDDDDDDWGGYPVGPPPPPNNGPPHLDPNYDPGSLGESLGIPIGLPRGNWGTLAALGLPGETECEFGACGPANDATSGGLPTINTSGAIATARLYAQIGYAIFQTALRLHGICSEGVFAYGGRSLDAGPVDGFAGTIIEGDTNSGISKGALFEVGAGEAIVGGVGKIVSSSLRPG